MVKILLRYDKLLIRMRVDFTVSEGDTTAANLYLNFVEFEKDTLVMID